MDIIRDITDFIFVGDEPQKSDIIFIPGGSYPEPSERAARLWREGYAPLILPSGRYSPKLGKFAGTKSKTDIFLPMYDTEWDFMRDVLIKSGVDAKAILKENEGCERGTIDNAFFSRKVTDALGLTINRAIICCKSFHARRCQMSYAWAYPDAEFFICPVDIDQSGRDTWYKDQAGTARVMSELRKCGEYFKDVVPVYAGAM